MGGTAYVELDCKSIPPALPIAAISFDDGTTNNRWQLRVASSFFANARVQVASVNVADYTVNPALPANTASRIAMRAQLDNYGLSANGSLVGADTSAVVPTVSRLVIGSGLGSTDFVGIIYRFAYFPPGPAQSRLRQMTL